MKIGIHTWGSEGDIRPFLALSHGLAARGHAVTLACTAVEGRDYGPLAAAAGYRLRNVGMDYFRAEHGFSLTRLTGTRLNQLDTIVGQLLDPVAEEMFEVSRAVCAEADLNIVHFLHHPAISAVVESARPAVGVFTTPVLPSREYAPSGVPDLGLLNRLSWGIGSLVLDRMLVPRANALRRRAGLPLVTRFFGDWLAPFAFTLTNSSPALLPRPRDWAGRHRVCGFINLPPGALCWEMPPALAAFLEAGPPPVFITFGSLLSFSRSDAGSAVELMVEAVRIAGCRAIVQVPEEVHGLLSGASGIIALARAPHDLVFPRCAAVVHHGGAGTSQSAAFSGCPSVVVAHFVDQFFWGALLRKRAIAPEPLRRRGLTARRLADGLKRVLSDPSYGERAGVIAAAMRAEEGLARAVEMIEATDDERRGSGT